MEKQPLPDGRGSDRSPDREGGVVPGPLPLFNCRRISLFLELFLRFFPDAACLRGLAVAGLRSCANLILRKNKTAAQQIYRALRYKVNCLCGTGGRAGTPGSPLASSL